MEDTEEQWCVWQGCKEKALFSAESASHLHMHESEDCLNSVSWIDEIKIDIFIYVRRVIYMEQEKKCITLLKMYPNQETRWHWYLWFFAASEQIWLVITDEAIKLFNSKIIRTSVSDLNDRKRYDDRKQ